MRYGQMIVVAVALTDIGRLFAQQPPATDSPPRETPAPAPATAPAPTTAPAVDAATKPNATGASTQPVDVPPFHGWVQAEYIYWWMKSAPLPVPIVTTGNPQVGFDPNNVNTINTAGAIGQPGTRVLFGDQNLHNSPFSGARLGLGFWVDGDETFGFDGNGFCFERLTKNGTETSDQNGNPPLYFPIFSAIVSAERAIPIADPLRQFSGDVGVHSSLRLWGAEANGVATVIRNPGLEWTVVAGFRYADLLEHLVIDNTTTDLAFNNTTALSDEFETRNQFYGGQIGSRFAIQMERFSVDATTKVALGSTHQVVEIAGAITQLGPNPLIPPGLGTFPGGIFTQSSNIGRRTANPFAVLSSFELKFGYNLTPRARVFAGYDLLFWDQVVRPGNQISRTVNLTQNAVLDPNGTGILVGAAQPAPLFDRGAFWAQGLTFGLNICF